MLYPRLHSDGVHFLVVGGHNAGRVVMELFADVCPKTAGIFFSPINQLVFKHKTLPFLYLENFRQFCTGEYRKQDIPLGYKVKRKWSMHAFARE